MTAERTLQKISVGHRVVKELLERYLVKVTGSSPITTILVWISTKTYWRMTLMQLAQFEPLEELP